MTAYRVIDDHKELDNIGTRTHDEIDVHIDSTAFIVVSGTSPVPPSARALYPGTGVTFFDGGPGGNLVISVVGSSSGSTSPGGLDKYVQFNDAGVFGGVSNFTFDKSTNTLTVNNLSGSLTKLSDGSDYLVGGSGIQITTGSNGSITITNVGPLGDITAVNAGLGLTGGGTSGSVTLAIDDSVVATISGATFQGPVTFNQGLSGSLTRLSDGSPYLVAGNSILITTSSNGSVKIDAYITGSGGGTITSVNAGLGLLGGGNTGDVTLSIDDSIVATISGATFQGPVIFNQGLSGSLTRLVDGSSYIIAGGNMTVTSGSNGSITLSTINSGTIHGVSGGLGLLGGGTSGFVGLEVDNSVVATLTGSIFTGPVKFNSGLSGSLTSLSDGSPYLLAGSGVSITTGSSGAITITATATSGSGGTITEVIAGLGLTGGGTSGSITLAIDDSVVATISGATFQGPVNFNQGLSGSLTRLVDGSPYLVAGPNVTVATNTNGSITISSTGGGANVVTLTRWMEVPVGDIDGMNMVYDLENTPAPPGSLMLYVNGVLQNGNGGDYLLSGNSIVMNYAPMGGSNILATYIYQIVLPSGPSVSWMETPGGFVDGVNYTFTLANAPDPTNSLMFYLNGILQKQGATSDYVLSGSTVTMNYVPPVGSLVTATYAYKVSIPVVGPDIAWMEVPTGDVDGVNYTFGITYPPLPQDALMFYINGVLQRQGALYDYTLSSPTTITMNYIPYSGSNVAATYPYDQSLITGDRPKYYANVTTFVVSNTDVSFVDGNLDAALPDMSSNNFLNDYDLYVNGSLMRPGSSYFSVNDYYPGSDLTLGKLRFKFNLNVGDVICLIPNA